MNYALSVSTLVLLANDDEKHEKKAFADVLRDQIKKLRKQLESSKPSDTNGQDFDVPGAWRQYAVPHGTVNEQQKQLDSRLANQTRVWDSGAGLSGARHEMQMPGEMPGPAGRDEREFRATAHAAARLGRSFVF